ncbi:Myb-like protein [Actinidia chinensis var. chinensis]|uniref:Myb-like protein n=1 Tax=Actinidia chinensis var. chinensis TaxID=1590841 RepID=A0A2R6RJE2_ACTCC|nr:Myb-like protein [Actinidia chinensis var. chinensis]
MSLTSQTLLKTPNFSLLIPPKKLPNLPHFRIPLNPSNFKSLSSHHRPLRAFQLDGTVRKSSGTIDDIAFDAFLSVVEFLSLASSAVISIGFAVNPAIWSSQNPVIAWLGNRVFVWQSVLLVGAVAVGALIRRRQWRSMRVSAPNSEDSGVNLIERIERLEEDVRSSVTVTRVLSRKLEKLGVRFRVTKKTLKDPFEETAALTQKNSEDTRALAMREDILEKELSEIQKVLFAMQEQQQKQLELILAIGKTGKLWDHNLGPSQDQKGE